MGALRDDDDAQTTTPKHGIELARDVWFAGETRSKVNWDENESTKSITPHASENNSAEIPEDSFGCRSTEVQRCCEY